MLKQSKSQNYLNYQENEEESRYNRGRLEHRRRKMKTTQSISPKPVRHNIFTVEDSEEGEYQDRQYTVHPDSKFE